MQSPQVDARCECLARQHLKVFTHQSRDEKFAKRGVWAVFLSSDKNRHVHVTGTHKLLGIWIPDLRELR
ncbi:MAG: hypothetical protein DWI22_17865 [Planctomycetota bacterium]|nr:MAG: hypothetical protein DWI22_17865 [Planctomycetota bacterium]